MSRILHIPTTFRPSFYSVGRYLSSGVMSSVVRPFRYHAVLLFRLWRLQRMFLTSMSEITEKYCQRLVGLLRDEKAARDLFKQAETLIKSALSNSKDEGGDNKRIKHFTTQLIQAASHQSAHIQTSNKKWASPSSSSRSARS